MKTLSKDQIKDRLIRRAAETWGVDEMEIEYSFDPIINIIFDACAHEFERVSDHIKTSRTRVTERLVDLLTPEVSVTAKPAHAIMHALPVDTAVEINDNTHFYHRKRMPLFEDGQRNSFKDFFFTPAGKFKISNCDLKYIASPEKIQEYSDHRSKNFLDQTSFVGTPERSVMYLAIKPGEGVENISKLLCYFDLLNFSQKELLLHHINISKWSINGKPLNVSTGYETSHEKRDDYSSYINQSIQSKIQFYEAHVQEFYKKHFYCIEDTIEIKDNLSYYPESFADFLEEEELKEFTEELLWIKITFSSVITASLLDNLHCHINCFPVINKKMNTTNRRLQPFFNIIPLEAGGDFFLDVHKVEGDTGNKYFVHDRSKIDDERPQAYLRYGGVSRFDERDASDLLNYVLDLLKEDSVAFSAMGDDFINSNMKDLKQTMARVEQRVEQRNFVKNKIPYLIINKNDRKRSDNETLFTSYWTTAGAKANKIHPFVRINQFSGTAFIPNSLTLITGTIGGEDEPTSSEKIYAYRENILSRGRVITRQDIIQHGYNHYKNSIQDIRIEKGVMVLHGEGIGYTPTTDIYIQRHEDATYSDEDWEYLKKDFLISLEERSANVLPFRIFYTLDQN